MPNLHGVPLRGALGAKYAAHLGEPFNLHDDEYIVWEFTTSVEALIQAYEIPDGHRDGLQALKKKDRVQPVTLLRCPNGRWVITGSAYVYNLLPSADWAPQSDRHALALITKILG